MQLRIGALPGQGIARHAAPCTKIAVPRASVRLHAKRKNIKSSSATPELPGDDEAKKKAKALEAAMSTIKGKYGDSSILWGTGDKIKSVDTTPSGCMMLDVALGGGWPVGRVVEIFGPESCGKSTLALHAIAEVQKAGKTAALIDAEHAFEMRYAQALGVDLNRLILQQPDFGEQALDTVDELARSNAVDLIVVDSVSALVPRAELENDVGAPTVGSQARLMSSAMRKLSGSANRSQCTLIFINQLRMKVGVMFGNPEITSGGNALKYYASVRVEVRKKETLDHGGKPVGIKVRAKCIKNKVACPGTDAFFDILWASGIDAIGGLIDAAEVMGVVLKKGAWYSFGEERLGQGRDKTIQMIKSSPQLLQRLQEATRAAMAANRGSPPLAHEDGDDELLDGDFAGTGEDDGALRSREEEGEEGQQGQQHGAEEE